MAEDAAAASARTTWTRLRSFDRQDWRDLAEASVTLAVSHLALRFGSAARAMTHATSVRRPRPSAFTPERQRRLLWLAGVAGRHVVPVPCLSRSVGLARMLARRGVQAHVRVGVRTVDGRLDAHAWVELDGSPVNEDRAHLECYKPLESSARTLTEVSPWIR